MVISNQKIITKLGSILSSAAENPPSLRLKKFTAMNKMRNTEQTPENVNQRKL